MSTPAASPPTPTPTTELAAFKTAAQTLRSFPSGALPPPLRELPLRLINIHTGAIVAGSTLSVSTPYVIASYVWRPDRCPPIPTFGWARRTAPWSLDPSQNTKPTSKALENWKAQSGTFNGWAKLLAERYPTILSLEGEKHEFKMPPNPLSKEEIDPDYLTEVFQLVAAEAHRQGTDWMWMDSLCVDQHDPADKAVQIPRMRDYYANALCCVVVSESIRRRVAPIAPVPAKVSDNADIVGDGMDFPPHLLECWTVGFHDERVWTLQETLLAKEVVCRGANVRIDATRLLDPSVRENYRMNTTGAILNAFPTMGALLGEGVEVTPQYCLRLCRNRGSKFLHDHVYGMLGLFPEKIRKSLPVDYETLTPSAVLAIFSYLRVKEGDLSALLTLWDRKTFPNQKCTTPLGPSWILVGFGYAQTEIRAFVPHEDVNAQVDDTEGAGYALHATMAYTQVTSIESRATVDPDDWTMNADLMDDANYAVEIEDSAMTYGATVEVDGDHVKNIDVKKIVAAAVGKDPRTLDNGESENVWVWLLLAETEDNGWTRLGIMFTDELNPPEKKRFRIT